MTESYGYCDRHMCFYTQRCTECETDERLDALLNDMDESDERQRDRLVNNLGVHLPDDVK